MIHIYGKLRRFDYFSCIRDFFGSAVAKVRDSTGRTVCPLEHL
jgi:hypothetical protein